MAHQYDLLGEYYVTLDTKGRFRLPSGLLRGLGDRDTLKFVVNRGFDNCLTLYPKPVWDRIKVQVDALNKFNRKNLQFTRIFYRGASEVVPDSADRLLLPKQLLSWAKAEKNLVLSAMDDRIEIWAEAEYEEQLNQESEDFAVLAEEVLGGSGPVISEPPLQVAYHVPVLADESVGYLNLRPGGVYVDATFGGGGHSRYILERAESRDIRLFGFDQDEAAAANALDDSRFTFVAANFRNLRNFLRLYGVDKIDGLLADLGVSSHQFDEADRGFSFRFDAALDMRMGTGTDRTAADVVNNYSPEDLQAVLGEYGEVRNARSLALALAEAREQAPIVTIQDLLRVVGPWVRGARPRYLAQVFQALRIEVNDEIGALKDLLAQATDLLIPQTGRLSVISYHSLEDRITKNFLKTGNAEGVVNKDFYGKIDRPYKVLTKKPVLPPAEEIQQNSRARSAKLRAGERQ